MSAQLLKSLLTPPQCANQHIAAPKKPGLAVLSFHPFICALTYIPLQISEFLANVRHLGTLCLTPKGTLLTLAGQYSREQT